MIEDCYSAVHQLYVREVLARPVVEYEFLARGVSPTMQPLESVRTPRKYIVRKWISVGGHVVLVWESGGVTDGLQEVVR